MKTIGLVALTYVLALPLATAAETAKTETEKHPRLAGSWSLDEDASDDAREKLREAMGGGGPGMDGSRIGGPRGGRPGAPDGRGDMGGGMPGEMGGRGGEGRGPDGGGRGGMRELLQAAKAIAITEDGSSITFRYGDGDRQRTLLTDGTKVTKDKAGERQREIRAEWKGSQLVVHSESAEAGSKVTETYELGPNGKRLSIRLEIETQRSPRPIVVMRIYNRTEANDEEPAAKVSD